MDAPLPDHVSPDEEATQDGMERAHAREPDLGMQQARCPKCWKELHVCQGPRGPIWMCGCSKAKGPSRRP